MRVLSCVRASAFNLAVFLLACRVVAFAAGVELASLKVVVLDPNGSVIVASRVRVKPADGDELSLNTDQRGQASFSGLTTGAYQVHVEAEGFAPKSLENVVLKPGVNLLEVRLEVGALSEDVVVGQDEREKQTDPRGDAFATILTGDQIADLPDDPDELESTLQRMAGPGAVIRVNGFRGGRLPPKSQISQIRFRRNSYAAEYHEVGLTGVDVITKPGGDSWHGSLSFAFSDEALNARNAFAPARAPEQLRRFEMNLSVPLWRDRTSLFLAAESDFSFDARTIVAALPEGTFNGLASRPSRTLYTSARVAHLISKTHTLNVGYERTGQRTDNLGVGNFDLPERAYSLRNAEHLLRVSEAGIIGKRLFNEFRFQLGWRESASKGLSDAPAVIVLNAFNRGGAQRQSDHQARELEFADNVDFAFRQHTMRAGLLFESGAYTTYTASNASGTFIFASLDDFRAGLPATFNRRVGQHPVEFSQYHLGGYWQDDLRVSQGLTLSSGLRYEWQNHLNDHNNFAPRVGFAWSPFKNGRTTIRGGAGVFYDWFDSDTYAETLSLDGQRQLDLVVRNPGFPDPFSGGSRVVLPPGRLSVDPLLVTPYVGAASIVVERQLGRGMRLRASYLYQRGVHLLRGRDINAPVPGVGRPDPVAGNVVQVESSANSKRHQLNLSLNSAFSKKIYYFVDYTLSGASNEADGPFGLPANNFDLRAERGPSPDDVRHRLFASVGLDIFKGLRLGTTFYANSGLPYSITTGRDDNGDTTFNDRPAGVSRNSARGATQWDLGMRLSWIRAFGERQGGSQTQGTRRITVSSSDVGALASELDASEKKWRINLYLQISNVLNHVNFTNYTGVQTSPFFGQPTAALPGRRIETGLRFGF
jgi:hypothetical protein